MKIYYRYEIHFDKNQQLFKLKHLKRKIEFKLTLHLDCAARTHSCHLRTSAAMSDGLEPGAEHLAWSTVISGVPEAFGSKPPLPAERFLK